MRTSVVPSVLWREGMFLSTQHFQVSAAELAQRIASGDRVGTPCTHGLIHLVINEADLDRSHFTIEQIELLLGDGTLVRSPGNAEVASTPFGEHLQDVELTVWIGLPQVRSNVPQLRGAVEGLSTRYRAESRPAYDENLVDSSQNVEVRVLTPLLFFGQLAPEGYDCVPIARLYRDSRKAGTEVKTRLSPTWVPPMLALGAAPSLVARLAALAHRARDRARDLGERAPSIALLANVEKGVDLAGFLLLQTIGRTVMTLEQLAAATALDPFTAYLELVRICGDLSAFAPERAPKPLPTFEQNDCSACFNQAIAEILRLIEVEVAMPYDSVPFRKDERRERVFVCRIPERWLEVRAQFYLAIDFDCPGEDMRELVDNSLVKLSTPSRIEMVQLAVGPDIELTYQHEPPRSIPPHAGRHFFRVESEGASRDAWLKVIDERSLAVASSLGLRGDDRYYLFVELPK